MLKNIEFIEKILKLIEQYDFYCEIYWDSDLKFYVMCSDSFSYACADAEDVNLDSFYQLEQAIKDASHYDGLLLYCARRRKMRPLREIYNYIEKDNWQLFNDCGPEREIGLFNPCKPGEIKNDI